MLKTAPQLINMTKKFLLLFFALFCVTGFSQVLVNTFPIKLKRDQSAFQVVDSISSQVAFFVSDKTTTNAFLLDNNMKVLDSIKCPRPESDYTELIGYAGDSKNPTLFWGSGNSKKKVLSQKFNFETHDVAAKNFEINLKEEQILQKLSSSDKFYIVTVLKKMNIMKIYLFDTAGNLTEKSVSLEGFRFFRPDIGRATAYQALGQTLGSSGVITKIDATSPTSLTESSIKRKCYFDRNKFYITLDDNIDYTHLITIDLRTFTAAEKFLKLPFIASSLRSSLNSNSFILDDKIYQVKFSSDEMHLLLSDFNDNLLNKYQVGGEDQITFKNTPIKQVGGDSQERILDKTKQFIRKANNLNTAISCYSIDGKTLVTLGSVSSEQNNGLLIGGMFGVAGVLIAYAVMNPTMDNFNAYENRTVVYIDCLFDDNGTHIIGKVPKLAFEKITNYRDGKKFSGETMFRFGKDYYYGFYEKSETNYSLRKFSDD